MYNNPLGNFFGMIESLIPGPAFRWKPTSKEHDEKPVGVGQLAQYQDKLRETMEHFINNIFANESVSISHQKTSIAAEKPDLEYLENHNGNYYSVQLRIAISTDLFIYEISNIPKSGKTARNAVLFDTLLQYFNLAMQAFEGNLRKLEDGKTIIVSDQLMHIADYFLASFARNVALEFLFSIISTKRVFTSQYSWVVKSKLFINFEILTKTYDFAIELSTLKVENREIKTGFAIISKQYLEDFESHIVRFKSEKKYGNFKEIKNLVQAVDGRRTFFAVVDEKIIGIFFIDSDIIESESTDANLDEYGNALLVSIQGTGGISYFQYHSSRFTNLFEIINGRIQIRDNKNRKQKLKEIIESTVSKDFNIEIFIPWIFKNVTKKKGTTFIIGKFTHNSISKALVSSTPIDDLNLNDANETILENFSNLDGGIILNKSGRLLYIGAIFEFKNKIHANGGARHTSAINFTHAHKCLAITVSEDGGITMFENGALILSL